jgi:hypothetical protein
MFALNANYSIAITGSVISLIILFFYKGNSAALAFAVAMENNLLLENLYLKYNTV